MSENENILAAAELPVSGEPIVERRLFTEPPDAIQAMDAAPDPAMWRDYHDVAFWALGEIATARYQHGRIMDAIRERGLPVGETEWRDAEYRTWELHLALVVECPDCAFTFGADHTDDTPEGGYSCPACHSPVGLVFDTETAQQSTPASSSSVSPGEAAEETHE